MNIDAQFGRVEKFINHPVNLPTITLHDTWLKKLYICTHSLTYNAIFS